MFPRVSSSLRVLLSSSHRQSSIVVFSVSGWNHFISLCVSAPVFPSALGLARLRNSVDHTLGVCFGNTLTCDFWQFVWYHDSAPWWWTHPELMCLLDSNEVDDPFVPIVLHRFWTAGPIIQNKQGLQCCSYECRHKYSSLIHVYVSSLDGEWTLNICIYTVIR